MSEPLSAGPAFDSVARVYDDVFVRTAVGFRLREVVRERLARTFRPGDRILEVGCGTGEDALWLTQWGVRVTATDVSSEMLEVLREKAGRQELGAELEVAPLDLARPDSSPDVIGRTFDGAFSNFGALNCVEERGRAFAFLGERLRPDARLIVVVMGPVCLWEIAWHLARGRFRDAFRRLGRDVRVRVGEGSVPVWYPSGRTLCREAAPWFEGEGLLGVGAFLPPPYLDRKAAKWPSTLAMLSRLEERWADRFPWSRLSDHYLLVLRRR